MAELPIALDASPADGEKTEISRSPRPTRKSLLFGFARGLFRVAEGRPVFATMSVIIAYIFGFVVTNAHLARFEVVTFDLWQGRYLAAGILFLLITPVPLL